MASFFTREGDEGFSGLLGKGRVPKFDLRMEALGALDEANSALGLSRAILCLSRNKRAHSSNSTRSVSLDGRNCRRPRKCGEIPCIDGKRVEFLEEKTDSLGKTVVLPKNSLCLAIRWPILQ